MAPSPLPIAFPLRSLRLLLLLLLLMSPPSSSWGAGSGQVARTQKTWCVARPSSDEATLQQNIDFACSQVDCSVLQSGCACFNPNTRINHASVAMNLYYQSRGRNYWNCHFRASGLVVQTDPSYGNCMYV